MLPAAAVPLEAGADAPGADAGAEEGEGAGAYACTDWDARDEAPRADAGEAAGAEASAELGEEADEEGGREEAAGQAPGSGSGREPGCRGLHSFTFQLNVSTFWRCVVRLFSGC